MRQDLPFATVFGRRWYLTALMLAGIAVLALEYTGLGSAFYDLVSRKAAADNAAALQLAMAQEKAALAMKAAEDAKRAAAEAETAKQVALNSQQRQTGDAQKADGEGAVALARSPYADQLAEQELRVRKAEAAQKEAEAERAKAQTAQAEAEAQRARVAAAKDLVDCKKNGFVLGYMTGEGCDAPPPNGQPQTKAKQEADISDRLGFTNHMPAELTAGNEWLPKGTPGATETFERWTRAAIKSTGFSAFAVSHDGISVAGRVGGNNLAAVFQGAIDDCKQASRSPLKPQLSYIKNRDSDCRVIMTRNSADARQ